ncbi:hypothetical protein [Thiocapsa marina]|uniref:Uncharacterized protein n=1 Tax=Thiocapsa marina 5811 TaxID=768671 RepID=F9UDP2_9GAMM|nr:hypothetical protein [Thiocapsa marina]EGV17689.1 hypothetical protein ThimaDRAFT_3234 [Thiocapsa marina 5811]
MMTFTSKKQWTGAALALLITGSALGAPPVSVGQLEFEPIRLADAAGAKLERAILTYMDDAYEVRVNGLGIGGAAGVTVSVTGEVSGLKKLMDLEDIFVTSLADPSETDVSSDDLWIQSDRGVTIRLRTDNPNVGIAPGSDEVTVLFGWGE